MSKKPARYFLTFETPADFRNFKRLAALSNCAEFDERGATVVVRPDRYSDLIRTFDNVRVEEA